MAKTVRKKNTPIPVQVSQFVSERTGRAPFSAKDVYDQIDHPARHKLPASIGNINKALVRLWSEGRLCSFRDEAGAVMRESEYVASGSAAVSHPQMFALPGSKAPTGYTVISYEDAATSPEPAAPKPEHDAGAEKEELQVPEALELADGASDLAHRAMTERLTEAAAEWIPDALMEDWVTRRTVVLGLREGFDKAEDDERRQLIMTGLQRRGGMPKPDSPVARNLVKLCHSSATWWSRISRWAFEDDIDQGHAVSAKDMARLEDDSLGLVDNEEYDVDAVVLACLRLGIDNEGVRILATEAESEPGAAPSRAIDDALVAQQAKLELANDDLRESRAREREQRQGRAAAEKQVAQLRGQLNQAKASAKERGDEAAQVTELRAQLAEALEQGAELAAAQEALAEERERVSELEREVEQLGQTIGVADAELASAGEEARRLRASEDELQDALRRIGELNVRLADAEQRAGQVPTARDARSLVSLLDSTIGQLVSESSARIGYGDATDEDQLMLAFASQFLSFKLALPTAAALPDDEPPVVDESVAADQAAVAEESETLAGETLDEPETVEADMETEAEAEPEVERARPRRRRTKLGWTVRPIGGAGEIGASAIVAQTPSGQTILLDAGQRVPALYGAASEHAYHFGVTGVERLDAILVSHAHIDHTGSLPVLHRNARNDFAMERLPVYMSEPTKQLAEIMMRDSAKIQHWRDRDLAEVAESDLGTEFAHGMKSPAYDDGDVSRVLEQVETRDPRIPFQIPGTDIVVRLEPVSHVLGSCAIHLLDTATDATLLYTGDLGPITDPQLTLPDFGGTSMLSAAQMIVMESTYGRPRTDAPPTGRQAKKSYRVRQVERLHKVASAAIERGGCVLIPCFSLGRAQELARIIHQALNRELPDAPVYIGGMAERILEVYDSYADKGDRGHGERWVTAGQFPRTTSLHKRVSSDSSFEQVAEEVLEHGSGYILASPAVLSGGWSRTFAQLMVEDPRNAIIFTGFLPNDDRHSRRLSDYGKGDQVKLVDTRQTIKTDWEQIGLSAHANSDDLRLFAERMAERGNGGVSFGFVHGTPDSEAALAADVAKHENVTGSQPLQNGQTWTTRF